ncbi:epidermal growth factor receptor-like [Drosophila busckii]|uniref:epidermal growth factor receptor-like n=1 Tax=Drosophila busckii TaxID=30019 RepID=UPI00083EC13C|nr:epidermal growth factor receptor-like [Drosophila busckii]XP_017839296.1 epidermal growth factor receptor-like [Drosophila busckii]
MKLALAVLLCWQVACTLGSSDLHIDNNLVLDLQCPVHLFKDGDACVQQCPLHKRPKRGECVSCNEPCPKTCQGLPDLSMLHVGNIDSFQNCTYIEGDINVLHATFSGHKLGPMHPDRLEVFSTVKEINGNLLIYGAFHDDFKNLSYFRNLEAIHGFNIIRKNFEALYIGVSSLSSLQLRNLKRIGSGRVVIEHNHELCYVNNIEWSKLQQSNDQKQFAMIRNNRKASECLKLGEVCSDQCNSNGCWGSGPDQCLNW